MSYLGLLAKLCNLSTQEPKAEFQITNLNYKEILPQNKQKTQTEAKQKDG